MISYSALSSPDSTDMVSICPSLQLALEPRLLLSADLVALAASVFPDAPDSTATGTVTGMVTDVNTAATGTVAITGTPEQGQTLRAAPSSVTDADGEPSDGVVYGYQWQRGTTDNQGTITWADISGATASSYTLVQADVGHTVQVVVSFDDAEGNTETLTSAATGTVTDVNIAATGPVTITGTAAQGQTLTADTNSIRDADGLPRNVVYSYQWQRGSTHGTGTTTWTDIASATASSYTLVQADVRQKVRVVVSFDDAEGNTETLTSAASAAVTNVNDAATGSVTITGTAAQGQELTATGLSSIADADGIPLYVIPYGGVVYRYQWQRGTTDNQGTITWADISGATASSYTLVQADVGHTVQVVVSFEDELGGAERLTSAATGTVTDVNIAAMGPVTITGTAAQGETLTADTNSIRDADGLPRNVVYSYQWQRSTGSGTTWTDIASATGASYTLVQADVGHTVQVVVSFDDAEGNTETLTSAETGTVTAAVTDVNTAATGTVTITGTAAQGQTLRAAPSSVTDADGEPSDGVVYGYQWQRGTTDNQGTITWAAISGATASSYTLVQADVGHTVQVVVSFDDAEGNTETLTSAATGTVTDVNIAATGPVTITGTAAQGQTLTADTNSIRDADGLRRRRARPRNVVYSYQWQRGSTHGTGTTTWTDIASATASSYTLVQADVRQKVRVVVSFDDAEGNTETLTSAASAAVTNVNDAATGTVGRHLWCDASSYTLVQADVGHTDRWW